MTVRGIQNLAGVAREWAPQDWRDWLDRGLTRARRPDQRHLTPRAFPPIDLSGDGDVIRQLGEALRLLRTAQPDGAASFGRAMAAIQERLGQRGALQDIELDRDYWRLVAGLEPTPLLANAAARSYLDRLRAGAAGISRSLANSVIEALAGAVASAPPSSAQVAFFDRLSDDRIWWRPVFAPLAVDCAVALSQSYRQGLQSLWPELRSLYGPWLSDLADPATPAGRALLRSLAKRFAPRAQVSGDNEVSARNLRKALHLDNVRGEEPERDVYEGLDAFDALARFTR